jgi:hypothetical protein
MAHLIFFCVLSTFPNHIEFGGCHKSLKYNFSSLDEARPHSFGFGFH